MPCETNDAGDMTERSGAVMLTVIPTQPSWTFRQTAKDCSLSRSALWGMKISNEDMCSEKCMKEKSARGLLFCE